MMEDEQFSNYIRYIQMHLLIMSYHILLFFESTVPMTYT